MTTFIMISTLSTGLNKSDEYIRNNCIDIRMRQITFKNDEKTFFTKDDKIPTSEVSVRRYVRCSTLGFPKKFRICHDNLLMSVVIDSVEKKVTITPQDIDSTNLIMALASKLPTVGIALRRIVLNDTYYGCKLRIMTPTLVMEINSKYCPCMVP